jgi:hypothetical protein
VEDAVHDVLPVNTLPLWEEVLVNTLFGLLALAALVWAISVWVREKKKYALMMFIGATLASFAETLIDVMLQVVWTEGDNFALYEAYGRHIPPYCMFGWILYFFPMGLWVIKRTAAGEFTTMSSWRKLVRSLLVKAFLFELIPIWRYWWQYYGEDQPLMFWRLPMHWLFINTASLLFACTVVFFLQRFGFNDDDRYSPVYALVYPMALFGSYFMTNLPVGFALNSTQDNLLLTNAGALITIGLCMLKLELCGRAVVTYTNTGQFSLLPAAPPAPRGDGEPARQPADPRNA